MKTTTDRRQFLTMLGTSLGIGVLYTAMPAAAAAVRRPNSSLLGEANGERPRPFSFVQLSDAHVGVSA
jgi:hypothetical protein